MLVFGFEMLMVSDVVPFSGILVAPKLFVTFVASPENVTQSFGATKIPLNGTTSLTINISNPNTNISLTGLSFTDNLPAGLVVATPNGLTNSCGGKATATPGS